MPGTSNSARLFGTMISVWQMRGERANNLLNRNEI
jgi:hypothetical protein